LEGSFSERKGQGGRNLGPKKVRLASQTINRAGPGGRGETTK